MCYQSRHISGIIVNEEEYISYNIFRGLEIRITQWTCIIWIIVVRSVNLEWDLTWHEHVAFSRDPRIFPEDEGRSVSKFPRWVVNSRPWENRRQPVSGNGRGPSRRSYNGLWSNLGLGSQRIFYIWTLHDLSPSTNLPS